MATNNQVFAFDPEFYLSFYPDLKKGNMTYKSANKHYFSHGQKENRVGSQLMLENRVKETQSKIDLECIHLKTNFFGTDLNELKQTKINILIRTSSRPNDFELCIQSILSQKYKNYRIIICYDTPKSMDYLSKYVGNPNIHIFPTNNQYTFMCEPYKFNLYCNDLIKCVTDGYIMFLDDDNVMAHPFVLSTIHLYISLSSSLTPKIIVWTFGRPDMCIEASILTRRIKPGTIDTSMVCFPASCVKPLWINKQYGDYIFFSKLFAANRELPIFKIPFILTKPISINRVGNFGLIPISNLSQSFFPNKDLICDEEPENNNDNSNNPHIFMFDWQFYLYMYPDLHNILNEVGALNHYIKFGIMENRRTHVVIKPSNNYPEPIPVEFILQPNIHVHISKGLSNFSDRIVAKYGWCPILNNNNNKSENSTIFFGIYTDEDLYAVQQCNKGVRYIIWGGEDLNISLKHSKQTVRELYALNNCVHLSISKCLYNRVNQAFPNTTSIFVDFNLVDTNLFFKRPPTHIKPLNTVLIFNGQTLGREHIYGKHIYDEVMKLLPQYNYIFSNALNLENKHMPNVYASCMCMLRLTLRDGNSNSVQECEAMGVPAIHNFSEYGIKWKTVNDVVQLLKKMCKI